VAWNKLKSLFVVTEGGEPLPDAGASGGSDTSHLDPALAKYLVPEDPPPAPPLPEGTSVGQITGSLDFQGLYDQAGIPNTDEVEGLEIFLANLDDSLPQSSKQAAAKAYLGAIKKSPAAVLEDAERKIRVVRAIEGAKRSETEQQVTLIQAEVDSLQKQIDERRSQMEAVKKDLESVRTQCASEEGRLQGARMFFGAMDALK
jgi:hypothetical protein